MPDAKPGPLLLAKRVVKRIGPDNLSLASAGMAFYSLLAIFPALAALLSFYGLISDPEDVSAQLHTVSAAMPKQVVAILEGQLTDVSGGGGGALTLGALLSFAFSLWSSTKGTTALIGGLNIAFGVREARNVFAKTLTSLLITAGLIFGLTVALAVVAILPAIVGALGLPIDQLPMAWLRWPLLLFGITVFAGQLYRWGPCRPQRPRRSLTPGALTASVLWVCASAGFSWYVESFGNYNETYGSVGAVVVLMMWLYLTAFTLLIGAEVDGELTGTREPPSEGEEPVEPADAQPDRPAAERSGAQR